MTKLESKVAVKNRSNKLAMELYDKLAPIFAPYVGKKIEIANGGLIAKLKNEIQPAIEDFFRLNHPCQVYQDQSRYCIRYVVRVWDSSSGSTFYGETSVNICNTDGGEMKEIYGSVLMVTDFKAEDIQKARDDVRKAREVLQSAESRLCYFGEHDNH